MSGLRSASFSQISLGIANKAPIIRLHHCTMKLNIWGLIQSEMPLSSFSIDTLELNIYQSDSINNFKALPSQNVIKQETSESRSDNAHFNLVSKALRVFHTIVEGDYSIQYGICIFNIDGWYKKINIHSYYWKDHQLNASISEGSNSDIPYYHLSGSYNTKTERLNIQFVRNDNNNEHAVFTYRNALLDIKSMSLDFKIEEQNSNEIKTELSWNIDSLFVRHWRLNEEGFTLKTKGSAQIVGTKDLLSLACTNTEVDNIPIKANASYSIDYGRQFEFDLSVDTVEAQSFFIAAGNFFSSFKGFRCSGKSRYELKAKVNLDYPDSSFIHSDLDLNSFKLISFGQVHFSRYDSAFMHEIYEQERFIRTLWVGSSNSYFTSYSQVPISLVNAVLLSEDASFFNHRGFNEEAINHSLQSNIRQKRFARGGSTISMQLVKNLFLSRDKTVFRKLEEAMIVWMIENRNWMSKERMMEIYLNIIEWGPNIYGLGEASEYYFNKKPSELNLSESIWLASIIPNPKKYYYTIQSDYTLKPYYKNHFQLIVRRMLSKGMITESDTLHLQADVGFNAGLWVPGKNLTDTINSIETHPIPVEENQ